MNDPKKNLDEKFSEEFDSELEERINKDEPVLRDDDDEKLREWREWALSYENDKGDVID